MTPVPHGFAKQKAVLVVHVPGRARYAVLDARFKRPGGKMDLLGAGLPALVSTTDPNDVEILWDEVPSLGNQIEQRLGDAMQGPRERMEQAMRLTGAAQNATPNPHASGTPTPQTALPVDAMVESARQALRLTRDPAMRKTIIQQYRAAGIPVDEDDDAS